MTFRTSGGCVYVFGVPSGWHKIGVAGDPVKRCRDLQTGNHEQLTFVGATVDPNGYDLCVSARAMERRTHELLELICERRGEWFRAPLEVVLTAYRMAWYELCALEARRLCGEEMHAGVAYRERKKREKGRAKVVK